MDYAEMIAGYQRFRATGWRRERARWAELAEGQSPKVMVIACSDSRVEPAVIFDAAPGELFTVRNIANLVPPFENDGGRHGVSAAVEFAVTQLEVPEIVVLGHGACGGCRAALSATFRGAEPGQGGFIAHWIDLLDGARERVLESHGDTPEGRSALEHEAIKVSIANLRTFPFIPEREAAGTLRIHGAWFAIADGTLHLLDPETGSFGEA